MEENQSICENNQQAANASGGLSRLSSLHTIMDENNFEMCEIL